MASEQVLYEQILEGMKKLEGIKIIGRNKNSKHVAFKTTIPKEGVYVVRVVSSDFIMIDYDSPSLGMTVATFTGPEATAGKVLQYLKTF